LYLTSELNTPDIPGESTATRKLCQKDIDLQDSLMLDIPRGGA